MTISRCILLVGLLCAPGAVSAIDYAGPDNVAVVVNVQSAESQAIAAHYMSARSVPSANLCELDTTDVYQIPYDAFLDEVRSPLADCLKARGLEQQVLFLVTTRGVPGVIAGAGEPALEQDLHSVDSFLVDLHDELGYGENPYWQADQAFTRENGFRGYLVTRLDGPSAGVAMELVDRARADNARAGTEYGIGYFDLEPNGDNPVDRGVIAGAGAIGNGQIQAAHDLVGQAGWQTVLDEHDQEFGTDPALAWCSEARWYFGWYKAGNYNDAFEWTEGAVGLHLDSFSAMNFRQSGSWCAGALEAGIAATAGAVWEPYLSWYIHGDVFLEGFVVQGLSLAEAAYRAIPRARWMMVVFGDPLFSLTRDPDPDPDPVPESETVESPVEIPDLAAEPLPDPNETDLGTVLEPFDEAQGNTGGCRMGRAGGGALPVVLMVALIWLLPTGLAVRKRRRNEY